MSRDEIIELARAAGLGRPDGSLAVRYTLLEIFATFVAEAERERCCAIVFGQCESDNVAQRTVDAIRK